MRSSLKQHGVRNVRLKCMDFLVVQGDNYSRVDAIMLDVPCSGSGMSARLRFGDVDMEQTDADSDTTCRLVRLQALQRKMLVHAMTSFSNVTRIVYSTCSTSQEENESVVIFTYNIV